MTRPTAAWPRGRCSRGLEGWRWRRTAGAGGGGGRPSGAPDRVGPAEIRRRRLCHRRADGSRIDRFDANGRHQFSADPWTGAVRRAFSYDPVGRLRRIADADDNAVTVERDFDGNPTALVGPFGQRTELSVDRNGYLSRVVNPAGETWRMNYTADGLLTEFTDPKGQTARFSYDTLGRLSTATDRAGGAQTLTRAAADSHGFETVRVSGQGLVTRYRLENEAVGEQRREVISPPACRPRPAGNPTGP